MSKSQKLDNNLKCKQSYLKWFSLYLTVLEEKYHQIGEETKDGDSRSAFKVALPDMTSIARHLNMINRQLLDLS